MVTAIIQHEVSDFAEWKKVFDADLPNVEKQEPSFLVFIGRLKTQMM